MLFLRKIARYFNLLPCPMCKDGDGDGAGLLCPRCLEELPLIPDGPHCRGCGSLLNGPLAMCSECLSGSQRLWQDATAIMEYLDSGSDFMLRFKSGNAPELARPLGRLGAERIRSLKWKIDYIIPVPLRFSRKWKRSYNQSELFAMRLGKELDIQVKNALIKLPGGDKQAALNRKKRLKNPIRFKLRNPESLRGKSLLLVDDIFTTGSTLTAAAKTLWKANPTQILVMCCARTPLRKAGFSENMPEQKSSAERKRDAETITNTLLAVEEL